MNRIRCLHLLAAVLGCYLVGRAAVEPFVVDAGDPATYRHDWGGPSLVGVLAVHCGPGLIVLGHAVRRLASRRSLVRGTRR